MYPSLAIPPPSNRRKEAPVGTDQVPFLNFVGLRTVVGRQGGVAQSAKRLVRLYILFVFRDNINIVMEGCTDLYPKSKTYLRAGVGGEGEAVGVLTTAAMHLPVVYSRGPLHGNGKEDVGYRAQK